jgi:hypothetical protein
MSGPKETISHGSMVTINNNESIIIILQDDKLAHAERILFKNLGYIYIYITSY